MIQVILAVANLVLVLMLDFKKRENEETYIFGNCRNVDIFQL